MLINGDDIGFVECRKDMDIWTELVSRAGLKPSVGKNYLSTDFLMINSEYYTPVRGRSVNWYYEPFINSGLLRGTNTKKDKDSMQSGLSLGRVGDASACSHSLVRGFGPVQGKRLMKKFLTHWKPVIVKTTHPKQSWFAPRQLGGLGLAVCGSGVEMTMDQRMIATLLHNLSSPEAFKWQLSVGGPKVLPAYLGEAMNLYHRKLEEVNCKAEWVVGEDLDRQVEEDGLFGHCVSQSYLHSDGDLTRGKVRKDVI